VKRRREKGRQGEDGVAYIDIMAFGGRDDRNKE
jgi:hypothetical protein